MYLAVTFIICGCKRENKYSNILFTFLDGKLVHLGKRKHLIFMFGFLLLKSLMTSNIAYFKVIGKLLEDYFPEAD